MSRFKVSLGLLLTTALSLSCGAQRDLSGIWQQRCEEEDEACQGQSYLYELHLGRYGDELSGLMVRYQAQGVGGDSFQKPQECGCFFLEGGIVRDGEVHFSLFKPDAPGAPEHPSEDCQASMSEEICAEFTLVEGDERLIGHRRCGATDKAIVFEAARGAPRALCGQR